MPANVPSLFLLPLDLLTAKMESWGAALPSSQTLAGGTVWQMSSALVCFGWECALWVEKCYLGGNMPVG